MSKDVTKKKRDGQRMWSNRFVKYYTLDPDLKE